ncbi:phosphotransferase [Aliiroseovarius sp.]|uniref:phosphotransferase enzyme family protein n=1 Tax=Aliiroseovarius sp. TaxID=1872442 RepID=UPI002621C59B|nr:phosphotransferase [Aliiroseovarius sp.]
MSELKQALRAWNAREVRLIKDRENAVYEVRIGGTRAALRLHRPGYQTEAAIRSEITWMGALAEAGMSVPAPVPTPGGEQVVTLSTGRLATVVSWVGGSPIGESGVPLEGSEADQVRLFHTLGREVARMHNLTDAMDLPEGFDRHAWDLDGLLGETPFWGRFWESPALTAQERHLVNRARAVARDRAQAFAENGADFGLIHADVLRENAFVKEGAITLIDFDDAGFGFRLYDIAVMLSQNEEEPHYPAIRAAVIAGYRELRDLSGEAEELLDMFLMLRRFASMGWAVPRHQEDSAVLRLYTERAVRAARAFLAG